MSDFALVKLNEKNAIVINRLTGAWSGGDIKKVKELFDYLQGDLKIISSVKFDRNIIKMMKYVQRYPQNQSKRTGNPSLAVIHVGHSCNLTCTYCYSPKDTKKISGRVIKKIAMFLGEISNDLLIQFMGGEPLLHIPEMEQLVCEVNNYRKSKKTSFGIQTNALVLNEPEISVFLQNHNIYFGISFDGPLGMSRARYGRLTSRYEKLIEKTIKRQIAEGNSIGIISIINKNNIYRLSELIQWCIDTGITTLRINPMLPVKKGKGSFFVSENEYSVALINAYKNWVRQKWYKSINIDNFQAMEDNITSRKRFYMCRKYPCGAGIDQLAFDLNGDIYPCDYLVGSPRFKMGNVACTHFSEIRAKNVHLNLINLSLTKSDCGKCPFLSICGHCPSDSIFNGNSMDTPRSTCQADIALIREIFLNLLNNQEYANHVSSR